ncbi:MAG: dehydrogenase [Rhodocyclaceae bacterium]|jgi:L-2-hydroxyglutarate oxidase LhgO|uniref:FAD-dependent oxidoreductase n=1 Tax=Candidatus Desulfobacillus denitrificans TaxID=2608985 RepID=A0A809RY65_9PROT|nr:FAD-dependent oxidoreductase [Candidatus Desulfobacillus denitrificans]GJQ53517.1 MAG: dehydrogenase [Rhodocyclaceae bacterium]
MAMTEKTGAVVVGAGVVGLACARALARRGIETVILEANAAIGMETSSRNSEVIHAGLYYPAGSLKARLCIEGRRRLYAFCERHHVAHRRCGKLIVATAPAQEENLAALESQSLQNGVDDLRPLTAAQAKALEPRLSARAALLSPSTGIVDSHGLMLALLGDAEAHGAALALKSPLLRAEARGDGFLLEVGGGEPMRLACGILINSAGLHAAKVAAAIDGLAARHVPALRYARGNYFALTGRAPFSRLVYPLPEPGGLGVHLTLDLGGQARFGPDVEWVETIDYSVDPRRADAFYAEVRKYWPQLPDGALQPAYAGIRPKLAGPDEPAADFLVQSAAMHGVAGLVNLFGIESPGLTACLALAEHACGELNLR